jgi:hypothetical protein
LLAAGALSFSGCAGGNDYLVKHREEGTSRAFDLKTQELKNTLASILTSRVKYGGVYGADTVNFTVTPRPGEDAFDIHIVRPEPPKDWNCIGDVSALVGTPERSQARIICLGNNMGYFPVGGRDLEAMVLDSVDDEIRQAKLNAKAHPNAIAKEDLNAAVQAALKSALSAQAESKTVASDVDKPRYQKPEDANRFAVVIGIEKYQNVPHVSYAVHDAAAIRTHLLAMGVPQRNIFYAQDEAATRAGIVKAVHSWLPAHVAADSTVFFYYSGHGAPDPGTREAYLVPVDGDPEALTDTAYPLKSLYRDLGRLKVKRVVVALDSCFSGAGGRSVLPSGTRPLLTTIDRPQMAFGDIVTLAASKGDQISGTIDEQGHGAFTYYLLKGLNGDAADGRGAVTIRSLFDYLRPKVADAARVHNRDQNPELIVGPDADTTLPLR